MRVDKGAYQRVEGVKTGRRVFLFFLITLDLGRGAFPPHRKKTYRSVHPCSRSPSSIRRIRGMNLFSGNWL